jgi:flagellar operon protein
MDVLKNNFLSIEQVQDKYLKGAERHEAPTPEVRFESILFEKSQAVMPRQDLRFSKHAALRLEDRNISLSDEQMARLNDGARKASEKGIKESLVIVDSLAFIVNVPNNTVVTALERTESDNSVFTNIDGAVII